MSDETLLLTATGKMTGAAKKWYDRQSNATITSWRVVKEGAMTFFGHKAPFTVTLEKVKNRYWASNKEKFSQYANEKLDLMHALDLASGDQINLLANGIRDPYLRALALTVRGCGAISGSNAVDDRKSRGGTSSSSSDNQSGKGWSKARGPRCDNCHRTGHSARDCRARKIVCYRCQQEGHISSQCPRGGYPGTARSRGMATVSTVEATDVDAGHPVAAIREAEQCMARRSIQGPNGRHESAIDKIETIVRQNETRRDIVPTVRIVEIDNNPINLKAVIDTGSPISIVTEAVVNDKLSNMRVQAWSSDLLFKGVNETNVKILGSILAKIKVEFMENIECSIKLLVVPERTISNQILLGRDFLFENNLNLSLSYENIRLSKVIDNSEEIRSILSIDIGDRPDKVDVMVGGLDSEVGYVNKAKLLETFREVENMSIAPGEWLPAVKVYLKNDTVFSYGSRRFSYAERTELRQITDDLLARKIIKPSISPYCSRVVLVSKRNGEKRMCVDLRPLNSLVQKQRFTFPIIEDQLNRLEGKRIFTSLDLKDVFHQICFDPDSTKYFSFSTPHGQFEFLKLPFGYVETPAEFQKRILQIFDHLVRDDKILIYMDDVVIATDTIEQNLHILKEVLITLRKYNLGLNLSKCQFLKNEIEYLGYKVAKSGISMSDRHTRAISEYPIPKTLKQLQSFLGLTNYFRKFIKDYSLKANALHRLTKKGVEFAMDAEAMQAFDSLKKELITYPVLRLYKPGAETQLHTDSSSMGFGAVLLQKQEDGNFAPIAYFSKVTSDAGKKYHSYELETLAVVKAIERFHVFVQGIPFQVITDCNALVWAFKKININPRIARWSLSLQNYSFELVHRASPKMARVDALSRQVMVINAPSIEVELMLRQFSDERLRSLAESLEYKENKRFVLENGVVYRVVSDKLLFVVPECMIGNVIRVYHDEMGHMGVQKTMEGILNTYWFANMKMTVREHIANCIKCITVDNSMNRFEGEMQVFDKGNKPFETLHIDHFVGKIVRRLPAYINRSRCIH